MSKQNERREDARNVNLVKDLDEAIAEEMRKKGVVFNTIDANMDNPWQSFLNRGARKPYTLSAQLMVDIQKEEDNGEARGIGALDYGGPKRLYLYKLLCAMAELPVFCGKQEGRLLNYTEEGKSLKIILCISD